MCFFLCWERGRKYICGVLTSDIPGKKKKGGREGGGGSGRCLVSDSGVGGGTTRRYKNRGGTCGILHWESLCADAHPHARITVGNTGLASAQHSQTTSDRHDGWATERPQTDSLVDIDVTDTCLTPTATG